MSIWKCDILTVIPGRSLSLFFGVCSLLKPRVLASECGAPCSASRILETPWMVEAYGGEKGKGGLRRRGNATSATAERRERASSRSSEIVALSCLRASYRRYLFRRSAKQLAGPVGPANWLVTMWRTHRRIAKMLADVECTSNVRWQVDCVWQFGGKLDRMLYR